MCKARFLAGVLVLCAVLPVRGQTREELQARAAAHRARIDSLTPVLEERRAEAEQRFAQRRREALRRMPKLDTLRAGPFLIVARHDDAAAAAPVFARAWEEYAPLVGASASGLAGTVFVVRGDEGEAGLRALYGRPRHHLLDLPSVVQYRDRTRNVRAAIGRPLREQLPEAVQDWIGDGFFSAGQEMGRLYRELAIPNAHGTRLCREGDVASCIGVLGLAGDSDWLRFYSAPQVRDLVRQRQVGSANFDRCVTDRDDAACVAALMRDSVSTYAPLPLSHHARVALLEHALLIGGEGSFARMTANPAADVRSALEAASRSELTALVSSWLEAALQARPSAAGWLGRTVVITLFWVGVLLMLAMRSTRWRIG